MATEQEHENRSLGGYKAALHNPNVSDEAKHHATQVLAAHAAATAEAEQVVPAGDAHQSHVIRGYKATLTNPNTSDEAKAHAREKLAELGIKEEVHEGKSASDHSNLPGHNHPEHHHQGHPHEHHPRPHVHTPGHHVPDAQHEHHVLGGYKATLANPNTSEEAKAHAREMLAKAGQSVGGDTRDKEHEEHVIRGYKATLSNPNVSEEAKAHAREYLEAHGEHV